MGKMIYVDELKKLFEQEDNHFSSEDILNIIDNKIHIVDAVETDPGHWIATRKDTSIGSFNARKCSACGEIFLGKVENGGNYCPNCGVRMDEENEHKKQSPIVDAEPTVRCINCKNARLDKSACLHCSMYCIPVEDDFYCANGERMNGEYNA